MMRTAATTKSVKTAKPAVKPASKPKAAEPKRQPAKKAQGGVVKPETAEIAGLSAIASAVSAPSRCEALLAMYRSGRPVTKAELRALRNNEASLSAILNQLRMRGLIRNERPKGRASYAEYAVTSYGQAVAKALVQLAEAI